MSTPQERDEVETIPADDVNESTPLKPEKRTPLPKLQLFVLFLIQFAEPVTATVIYPFVNQFVRSTGITKGDERRTGYYAGMIESVFFLAEATTAIYWGRLSDYLGRKPVLLLGPFGLGITMTMFGLSKTFWVLLLSRCLQGVFNGNLGVARTVMVEISDHTNLADAYAIVPLMWTTGSTLGPIIGGLLSNPADRWPEFAKINFFVEHPYFLPCAAAALIAFVCAVFAATALKETLPSAIRRRKGKASSQASSGTSTPRPDEPQSSTYGSTGLDAENILDEQAAEAQKDDEKPPPFRDLMIPQVLRPLQVYGFLAFIDMCTSVLLPLVYSTSASLGGAGFDAYRIGLIMGVWGMTNATLHAIFLARILRWVGPTRMILICFTSYFTVLALYPALGYFARDAGYADTRVCAVIFVQLLCAMTNNAAYASMQLMIVENSPSRAALSTVNGISQTIGSGLRSAAPVIASSLFSVSLQRHLAGGNAVFYILMAMTVWGISRAIALPKYLKSQGNQQAQS